MTAFDKLSSTQKIRAAIHRDVRAITTEACHFLGVEATGAAVDIIAELVYKKLSLYGAELEAFAKHAKRVVINADDVKLLVRRNPSLLSHLNSIAPAANTSTNKARKSTTKPPETPAKITEDNRNQDNTNANKDTNEFTNVTAKDKESNANFNIEDDFLQDMVVDDAIDLTFD